MNRGETTGRCGEGCDTRHTPLRRRLYLYNFVGQILKIFECLELKSSCRKLFDKFTKILMKNFTEIKVHYFES